MFDPEDPNNPSTGDGVTVQDDLMSELAKRIERPSQITIDLPYEITFNGKQYRQLVVHEPTTSDVLFSEQHIRDKQDAWATRQSQMQLLSKCAKIEVGVVMRLKMRHFNEAMGYLLPFFYVGLEIHSKSALS